LEFSCPQQVGIDTTDASPGFEIGKSGEKAFYYKGIHYPARGGDLSRTEVKLSLRIKGPRGALLELPPRVAEGPSAFAYGEKKAYYNFFSEATITLPVLRAQTGGVNSLAKRTMLLKDESSWMQLLPLPTSF